MEKFKNYVIFILLVIIIFGVVLIYINDTHPYHPIDEYVSGQGEVEGLKVTEINAFLEKEINTRVGYYSRIQEQKITRNEHVSNVKEVNQEDSGVQFEPMKIENQALSFGRGKIIFNTSEFDKITAEDAKVFVEHLKYVGEKSNEVSLLESQINSEVEEVLSFNKMESQVDNVGCSNKFCGVILSDGDKNSLINSMNEMINLRSMRKLSGGSLYLYEYNGAYIGMLIGVSDKSCPLSLHGS